MTAWLFRLHRLDTGRHVAWAILCVEGRYCTLALPGVTPLVRRMLAASDWKAIIQELSLGLNPGPLPAAGPIAKAVAHEARASVVVQWVTSFEIQAAPLHVALTLDTRLRSEPHPRATLASP